MAEAIPCWRPALRDGLRLYVASSRQKKSTGLACNSILSRLSTSELRSSNLGRSGSRLLIPTIALSGHPMRDLPTEVNMGYTGGGPSPLCGVLRVPRAGLQEDEAAAGRTKTGSGGQ